MGPLRAHFEVSLGFCYDREMMNYWDELRYVLHDFSTSIDKPSSLSSERESILFDLQGRKV